MLRITRRTVLSFVVALSLAPLSFAGQGGAPNVTGTWAFDVQTDAGAGNPTISFKQDGDKLTGHYTGTFGEADLTGTIKGKDITFTFNAEIQGQALTSTYKGTVESATTMKGTLDISGIGGGTFTATKK